MSVKTLSLRAIVRRRCEASKKPKQSHGIGSQHHKIASLRSQRQGKDARNDRTTAGGPSQ